MVSKQALAETYVRWRRRFAESLGSDRYSFLALNELDRKLRRYIDFRDGFFVEAGANDGLRQNNTYWFERFRGWRGILIEGVPELARACRRNRPASTVIEAALVSDAATTTVTMKTAGLMSLVQGAFGSVEDDADHVTKGAKVQSLPDSAVRTIEVRARTLTSIISEAAPSRWDLLSLDVEGYEVEVLRGLDLTRHAPRFMLIEARNVRAIDELLAARYERIDQLSYHDYLYKQR